MGKDTTKKSKTKVAHYRARHKGLNHVPQQVTSHGFAERIRVESPQDRPSERVYCSVWEFETNRTDTVEMNNDNYPDAHKAFDNWNVRDRRRPHSSSSPSTSHGTRRSSQNSEGPRLSTPLPVARPLSDFDSSASVLPSDFDRFVQNPSQHINHPQGALRSPRQLISQQGTQHVGMSFEVSPVDFQALRTQRATPISRPVWEPEEIIPLPHSQPQFYSHTDSSAQMQIQAYDSFENSAPYLSPSTQVDPLIFQQGQDPSYNSFGIGYPYNAARGGEPLAYYPPTTWQYPGDLEAPLDRQTSPPGINDNLLESTHNPYPTWNQPPYQYPPQEPFY